MCEPALQAVCGAIRRWMRWEKSDEIRASPECVHEAVGHSSDVFKMDRAPRANVDGPNSPLNWGNGNESGESSAEMNKDGTVETMFGTGDCHEPDFTTKSLRAANKHNTNWTLFMLLHTGQNDKLLFDRLRRANASNTIPRIDC